jgi:hypothetical protein
LFEEIHINNSYLDMDEEIIYIDPITNEPKIEKPSLFPPPSE